MEYDQKGDLLIRYLCQKGTEFIPVIHKCNEKRCGVKLWARFCYFILVVDIIVKISAFRGNIHVPWILSAFRVYICILWKYPRSVDIIRILWKYPRSIDIIRISCIYPYFVEIICILCKYPRSVDIIRISSVPYLTFYSSRKSDWCITYFTVCNLIYLPPPSSFHPVRFLWVNIN